MCATVKRVGGPAMCNHLLVLGPDPDSRQLWCTKDLLCALQTFQSGVPLMLTILVPINNQQYHMHSSIENAWHTRGIINFIILIIFLPNNQY